MAMIAPIIGLVNKNFDSIKVETVVYYLAIRTLMIIELQPWSLIMLK